MLLDATVLHWSHLIRARACQDFANGYFQPLASHSCTQLCWTTLVLMLFEKEPTHLGWMYLAKASPDTSLFSSKSKARNKKGVKKKYLRGEKETSGCSPPKMSWGMQHYLWLCAGNMHSHPAQYLLKPKGIIFFFVCFLENEQDSQLQISWRSQKSAFHLSSNLYYLFENYCFQQYRSSFPC